MAVHRAPVAEDGGVARCPVQLPAHPGETRGDLFGLFRLFGNDAREGAFALDALEVQGPFFPVAVDGSHQRSGDAEDHHGPGDRLFAGDHFQRAALAIDLDHRVSVGAVVGLRHETLAKFLIAGHVQRFCLAADADERGQAAVFKFLGNGVRSIDDGDACARLADVQQPTHRCEIDILHLAEVQQEGGVFLQGGLDVIDSFAGQTAFDINPVAFRAKTVFFVLHLDDCLVSYFTKVQNMTQ